MRIYTIIFAMFLVSCGGITVEEGAVKSTEEKKDSKGENSKVTTKTTEREEDSKVTTKITETVSESTEEGSPVTTCEVSQKRLEWQFRGTMKPYYDAKNDAPEGYRLPTRSELLSELDNNRLDDYGLAVVWTDTDAKDNPDNAWVVRTRDAFPMQAWKDASFQALYVKEVD